MIVNGQIPIPEILDIMDTGACFKEIPVYPINPERLSKGASSVGILKNRPMICGGYFPYTSKDCFTLNDDGKWENKTSLVTERYGAASVVINDKFWITGRKVDYETFLNSTDLVTKIYSQLISILSGTQKATYLSFGVCNLASNSIHLQSCSF